MKKILFTLEIALFLSTLPVVLGLAMSREHAVNNKSATNVPVVKKELRLDNYTAANSTTVKAS